MKDTKEQIRAMLESGFSNAQIRNFLGVSYEDIESVKNSQQEEELKLEEPEEPEIPEEPEEPEEPEKPETHKLKRVGQNGTKIKEESFKLIRQDIESGVKRLEVRRKFNISDALYYRIKKSKTYDDFCNIRKKEADKKRGQAYSFKVDDGEYHPRTREPKYTEELWNEGKKMHNNGIPYREIAVRQGFSINFIAKALCLPSYDALVEKRKKEQARRKAEFEETKAMVEAELKQEGQTSEHQSNADRKENYEPEKKSELPEPVIQERIEMPYTGRRVDTHRPTKVTKEVFDNIKERYLNGETTRQLADDTKLGRGTINRIAQADNIDEYFSKRDVERAKYRKTKKTEISSELVELRSMSDSLARIAEALEKIANQPKKRGLFRK